MTLSVPRPRSSVLPGLSLKYGDMLDGLFRIDSLVETERSILHLAGSQVADGKPVVIQILVAEGPSADQARIRFMAGVRKANALKGPHVAKVLDVGITPEGNPYVVREKAPARSLTSFLDGAHSFSTEQAVDIALSVCDALAEAHRHGLLHGDLGPRSVHLGWATGPKDVKVVDLGIGAAMAELGLAASTVDAPSLHLRAPEQLIPGRTIDQRADVWAVGSLLYTMLAGAPPFVADTPSSISVAVENDEPASLAGVPDALADLVDACLSKDPARRPATLGALAEALSVFSPNGNESLSRIRTHAAPLAATIETPSLAMPPALLAPEPAESQPTIVARRGYESFATRATRGEAAAPQQETTAPLILPRAAPSLDIPIDIESVRDVAKASMPTPTPFKKPEIRKIEKPVERKIDKTPEPSVVVASPPKAKTISVPPMTLERDMPTVITSRRRGWRTGGLAIAAASLAIGVLIGVTSSRFSAHAPAAAAAPPPPAMTVAAPKETAAPPPAQPALASTPASDLPNAAAPAADVKPAAKAAAPKAKAAASASPAKPAVDPLVQSASAPIPAAAPAPTQKANDDDLRKFLDDRR